MKAFFKIRTFFIVGLFISLSFYSCNKDTVSPKIYLNGSKDTSVIIGTDYKDLGVYAEDNKDGEITANVTAFVDNESNPLETFNWKKKTGVYTIKYSVSDEASNVPGEAERIVRIYNEVEPYAVKYKMSRINFDDAQVENPIGLEYVSSPHGDNQTGLKTLSLYANTKTNAILEFRNIAGLGIKVYGEFQKEDMVSIDTTTNDTTNIYDFNKIFIAGMDTTTKGDTVKYVVKTVTTDPQYGGSYIVNSKPGERNIQLEYKIERFKRIDATYSWPGVGGIGYETHRSVETFTQVGGEYVQN